MFAKNFLGKHVDQKFFYLFSLLIKNLNNRTALAPLSEQQAKFWIKADRDLPRRALFYDETAKYPVRVNKFYCYKHFRCSSASSTLPAELCRLNFLQVKISLCTILTSNHIFFLLSI